MENTEIKDSEDIKDNVVDTTDKNKYNNIYYKLQKMRVQLQQKNIKPTGLNSYSQFSYFELSDFLPHINEILLENKALSLINFDNDKATLKIINTENINEYIEFSIYAGQIVNIKGANDMQCLGAKSTYLRRYLYMIAFEISENDFIDKTPANSTSNIPSKSYFCSVCRKPISQELYKKSMSLYNKSYCSQECRNKDINKKMDSN